MTTDTMKSINDLVARIQAAEGTADPAMVAAAKESVAKRCADFIGRNYDFPVFERAVTQTALSGQTMTYGTLEKLAGSQDGIRMGIMRHSMDMLANWYFATGSEVHNRCIVNQATKESGSGASIPERRLGKVK